MGRESLLDTTPDPIVFSRCGYRRRSSGDIGSSKIRTPRLAKSASTARSGAAPANVVIRCDGEVARGFVLANCKPRGPLNSRSGRDVCVTWPPRKPAIEAAIQIIAKATSPEVPTECRRAVGSSSTTCYRALIHRAVHHRVVLLDPAPACPAASRSCHLLELRQTAPGPGRYCQRRSWEPQWEEEA